MYQCVAIIFREFRILNSPFNELKRICSLLYKLNDQQTAQEVVCGHLDKININVEMSLCLMFDVILLMLNKS